MGNPLIILEILDRLLASASKYSAIMRQAAAEGRDVSEAELKQLQADDDAARDKLSALIAAKRLGG